MRPIEAPKPDRSGGLADPLQSFEIWPHRSLGRRGQALLIGIVAAGALLSVLRLPAPAMLPMAIGGVITVSAMALALWSNNRSARRGEVVEIGPEVVRVVSTGANGRETSVQFSTDWVRLAVRTDRTLAHRVTLTESGRSCSLGECLSPEERRELALALSESLARARAAISPRRN